MGSKNMGHGDVGSNTLSFCLKYLTKTSMKPVQKVKISLQLLKVYERLEWAKCLKKSKIAILFTTKGLLMPILNPCRQLLQRIL